MPTFAVPSVSSSDGDVDVDELWRRGLGSPMLSFQPEDYPSNRPDGTHVYRVSTFSSLGSDDFDEDEEEERWRLKLPIHGEIALRRAFKRGEDPFTIERQQRSNYVHEIESKYGPLKDVDIVFYDVDYTSENQPRSVMAKMIEGRPISPGALPTPGQMNIEEYCEAFGGDKKYINGLMVADEENDADPDEQGSVTAGLLEDYFYAGSFSAKLAEKGFEIDPFEGRPASV